MSPHVKKVDLRYFISEIRMCAIELDKGVICPLDKTTIVSLPLCKIRTADDKLVSPIGHYTFFDGMGTSLHITSKIPTNLLSTQFVSVPIYSLIRADAFNLGIIGTPESTIVQRFAPIQFVKRFDLELMFYYNRANLAPQSLSFFNFFMERENKICELIKRGF